MRKLYIFSAFNFFFIVLNAQNLVPNPYFTDTVGSECPSALSFCDDDHVKTAKDWSSFGGTPDYFNSCSHYAGVPSNDCGYQNPVMGNAYCGLITYATLPNYREFIGAQLITPLIPGNKYIASIEVSRADSSGYATNNLGILFSTNAFNYGCIDSVTGINHAMASDSLIISETGTWTTVWGTFIADSVYNYVIVGNFFNDSLTKTLFEGESKLEYAYYYIGYVSVVPDTTTSINNLSENNFTIYPNPTTGKFHISSSGKLFSVKLFDITGRLCLFQPVENDNSTVDASNLPNGIYTVMLLSNEAVVEKKLLIAK